MKRSKNIGSNAKANFKIYLNYQVRVFFQRSILLFIISFCSDNYDRDLESVENEIDRIKQMLERRYLEFVQSIDNEKNTLLIRIEDHIRSTSSQ